MELSYLLVPMGIITYCLIIFAVLTGTRVIKLKVKQHKVIGLIVLISASLHGVIYFYLNYF